MGSSPSTPRRWRWGRGWRSTSGAASPTASRTPARSRSCSSRCSTGTTSERTTSSASRTTSGGSPPTEAPRPCPPGPGARRSAGRREGVEGVDQLAQPPLVEAVELEGDALEFEVVPAGSLGGVGLGAPDPTGRRDVGELLGQGGELLVVGSVLESDDHRPPDEAPGVVVGVEAEDLLHGDVDVVGDGVEGGVERVGEAAGVDLLVQEPLPALPVAGPGRLHEGDRGRLGLARLEEGEELEALVEGAE